VKSTRSIPKPLVVVLILSFFMFTAHNLILSALQGFVQYVTGDESALGISFGIFTLFAVLFRFVSGAILERRSVTLMLALGQVMLSVVFISYAASNGIVDIYIIRAFHGAAWALATVAIMTAVVKRSPPSRVGEGLGYYNGVNSFAMMVFPAVGSTIVMVETREAYNSLFVVTCAASVIAVVVALAIWRADHPEQSSGARNSKGVISRGALRPTLSIFVLSFGFGAVLSYSPPIAALHSVANPGLYFTWFAGSMIAGYGVGGSLSDRKGHGRISALGCGSMGIGLLIAAIGRDYVTYAVSACMLGIGLSLANVALNALASLVVPENEQARAMATYSAGMDGGIMVGSFAIAILLSAGLGLPAILLILAAFSFFTALNTPSLHRIETLSKNLHDGSELVQSP